MSVSIQSNGSPEGTAFAAHFHRIEADWNLLERWWISEMRTDYDAALIHPDDGWVDRQENSVIPCYPQFQCAVHVGDTIILGHHDKWRAVLCTGIKTSMFGQPRYLFEAREKLKADASKVPA